MKNYYVSRDAFHWRYRENGFHGWNYFPDLVKDQASMKKFFAGDNGESVALSIVNNNNQAINVFEVGKPEPDFSIWITQNAKDKFKIGRGALVSDPDAVVIIITGFRMTQTNKLLKLNRIIKNWSSIKNRLVTMLTVPLMTM